MTPADPAEPPSIQDRTDTGGPWSAAGPLIALALVGAMLINACLAERPAGPAAPTAAPR
jgi:hypothetical protein